MINKKTARMTAMTALLAGTLTVGGMMAYFTDTDNAVNSFTVGKISIELTEPDWDPDDATDITPGKEIEKNPTITNNGINDEFVFLSVSVPYKNIVVANADGTKKPAADTQLFEYEVNDGWTQVGQKTVDAENGVYKYLYAYTGQSADTMEALAQSEDTPALFDSVTFVNAVEGQGLEESTQTIDIDAYAIQSSYLGASKAETAPANVWQILSNQAQ